MMGCMKNMRVMDDVGVVTYMRVGVANVGMGGVANVRDMWVLMRMVVVGDKVGGDRGGDMFMGVGMGGMTMGDRGGDMFMGV